MGKAVVAANEERGAATVSGAEYARVFLFYVVVCVCVVVSSGRVLILCACLNVCACFFIHGDGNEWGGWVGGGAGRLVPVNLTVQEG